jgi:Domain of unknown function (DUF397)
MSMEADLSRAVWQKSTFSNGSGGACVEVARNLSGIIAIRDSKDPQGAHLVLSPRQWDAFLGGVRAGEYV